MVARERFVQEAAAFVRNETHVEGDYLLKSEIEPAKKHIRLVYGGKIIPKEIKAQIEARAKAYRLNGMTLTIQQGFSIDESDANMLLADGQQNELSRLRAELSKQVFLQDSLKKSQQLGAQLLQELRPLYPEIRTCGIAAQTVFYDSLKSAQYISLFITSSKPKKTYKDRLRIQQWFRSRMSADSVKVYIE